MRKTLSFKWARGQVNFALILILKTTLKSLKGERARLITLVSLDSAPGNDFLLNNSNESQFDPIFNPVCMPSNLQWASF